MLQKDKGRGTQLIELQNMGSCRKHCSQHLCLIISGEGEVPINISTMENTCKFCCTGTTPSKTILTEESEPSEKFRTMDTCNSSCCPCSSSCRSHYMFSNML
jgi:hypothetical protein